MNDQRQARQRRVVREPLGDELLEGASPEGVLVGVPRARGVEAPADEVGVAADAGAVGGGHLAGSLDASLPCSGQRVARMRCRRSASTSSENLTLRGWIAWIAEPSG